MPSPCQPLPRAVHDHADFELRAGVQTGFAAGWRAALEAVAAGHVELDDAWRAIGRRLTRDRVREDVATMTRAGERLRADIARRTEGLPAVDWPPVAVPGHPGVFR